MPSRRCKFIHALYKARCYVSAENAEEANKIFSLLVKDRNHWKLEEVIDDTNFIEKLINDVKLMQKQKR